MARDRRNGVASRDNQPASRRRASMTDSATSEDQCHQKKIFVGGLGHSVSAQTLREYFRRYGVIVDAVVLRWPDGRPRGFGYVTFASASSAMTVLQSAHKIAGSDVDLKRAVPGTNKLFVGGLPQNASAMELRGHFEQFGLVSDAVVMMDPATNRSRGFGFVCFPPGQDGSAALAAALGQYDRHHIRGKWIEVKSAAPPRKLLGKEQGEQPSEPVPEDTCVEDTAAPTWTGWDDSSKKPTAKAQSGPRVAPSGNGQSSAALVPPGLGEITSTFPAASVDVYPPPGLDMLPGPTYVETSRPHVFWPAGKPQQSPMPQHITRAIPDSAHLPSLLGAGHQGQFSDAGCRRDMKSGPRAAKPDPLKVPFGSYLTSAGSAPKDEDAEFFEASIDLRRSLEQLLKIQCEQESASIAR